MEFVLRESGIPFDVRPKIDGRPDIVIPGAAAYHDPDFPIERLFVVGLKTTCKDRWRQILNEGTRVPTKHLITMQRGISTNQLGEMVNAGVSLIVPASIHRQYPADSPMALKSIDNFIDEIRNTIP